MNLDGAPRVLGKQVAASQPAPSCEDFDKKLLTLLQAASVDKVVELLNRHIVRELRLSGDYLSIDGFTTLTVALPKTQVTRLRMASCGITDDYPVAELLDESSKLVELDLSSNRLALRSAQFIGVALARNNALASLDLSRNHFGPRGYCAIMRFLCASQGQPAANQTLQELSFRGNSDGEMFAPLYEHVHTGMPRSAANHAAWKDFASLGVPMRLTVLDLSDTGLEPSDPAVLFLRSASSLTLHLDGPRSFAAPPESPVVIDPATGGQIVQTTSAYLVTTTTATTITTASIAAPMKTEASEVAPVTPALLTRPRKRRDTIVARPPNTVPLTMPGSLQSLFVPTEQPNSDAPKWKPQEATTKLEINPSLAIRTPAWASSAPKAAQHESGDIVSTKSGNAEITIGATTAAAPQLAIASEEKDLSDEIERKPASFEELRGDSVEAAFFILMQLNGIPREVAIELKRKIHPYYVELFCSERPIFRLNVLTQMPECARLPEGAN